MAPFTLDVTSGPAPLDFSLLRDGPVTAYHSGEVLEKHLHWLGKHEYKYVRFDCAEWRDISDCLSALKSALNFPTMGENLNALSDALEDLQIPFEGGFVLTFEHYAGQPSHGVIDVLARQARWWLLFGRRLLVLIQTDDPRARFQPCGATPVTWNPDEWRLTSRDISAPASAQ
jgi:Barstar (barnase inhibitor)